MLSPRILALSLALSLPACAAASSTDTDDVTAQWRAQRMLQALVDTSGVAGLGAAVAHDGDIAWSGSAGLRDVARGLPVETGTRFRLASVSKIVAATAAAKLVESGQLDPDAPIQPLLPWFDATWPPVTTRQLAAHISGMPHYQAIDAGRGGVHHASVRAAAAPLARRQLLSEPGTAYQYSSWGYTLLSAVIEAAARKPFLRYLSEDITRGLDIGPDTSDGADPRVSRTYVFADGMAKRAPAHDYSYTWAGGGLSATPSALARFGASVMAGEIVSPDTLRWMWQPTRLADGSAVRDRDYEVGFGWRVAADADGAPIAHHAGVTLGARSALVLWPEERTAVSLLSNTEWVASIEQTAMLLAAPFRTAPQTLRERDCPVGTHDYEGVFSGENITGTARFAREAGVCVGSLSASGALGDWLNAMEQRDAAQLPVIGVHGDGLARAALVTPAGLYDLRAGEQLGAYTARFGTTRMLELRITAKSD